MAEIKKFLNKGGVLEPVADKAKERVKIIGLGGGFASYGVCYGAGEIANIVAADAKVLVDAGEAEYVK